MDAQGVGVGLGLVWWVFCWIGRGIWQVTAGARFFLLGAVDGAAWWRVVPVLRMAPAVRDPVLKITTNFLLFIAGQLLYQHALGPVTWWLLGAGPGGVFDWVFYVVWTLPFLVISLLLNVVWFQDFSAAVLHLAHSNPLAPHPNTFAHPFSSSSGPPPSPTSLGERLHGALRGYKQLMQSMAAELVRLLLLLTANFVAQYVFFQADSLCPPSTSECGIGWVVGRWAVKGVALAYVAWAQAAQVFDHVWAMAGRSFEHKLAWIESHPAYFCGFGAWMAAVIILVPPHVGSGIYYGMMPYSVLAALFSHNRPTLARLSPHPRTHCHIHPRHRMDTLPHLPPQPIKSPATLSLESQWSSCAAAVLKS